MPGNSNLGPDIYRQLKSLRCKSSFWREWLTDLPQEVRKEIIWESNALVNNGTTVPTIKMAKWMILVLLTDIGICPNVAANKEDGFMIGPL